MRYYVEHDGRDIAIHMDDEAARMLVNALFAWIPEVENIYERHDLGLSARDLARAIESNTTYPGDDDGR